MTTCPRNPCNATSLLPLVYTHARGGEYGRTLNCWLRGAILHRSARGGRRLWVGLGSLAMRPAVSKIQNLTHSDPAMRRIRGLRVPCCCVERASPKSQRLLRYAVFRLLKLPLPPLASGWILPKNHPI